MSDQPSLLIRQGWVAFAANSVTVLAGLFVPGHDVVSNHMSVLEAGDGLLPLVLRIATVIAGFSVFLFGIGCFRQKGWSWSWAGLTALLFGAGMMSNGIVQMGSPLHGLYGLPIFSVLVPVFFVAERRARVPWLTQVSLAASFVGLVYMWVLLIGLEPEATSGLTQRLASTVAFGWYALPALAHARTQGRLHV
jgi:hypothetical protein